MPARVVVVHDDPEFVARTATGLRVAGYDVATFTDTLAATDALDKAERIVEVLITRVLFPKGQPHGVALALMARMKRPGVKVLFVARPDTRGFTDGVGEFLPAPVATADIVAAVERITKDI